MIDLKTINEIKKLYKEGFSKAVIAERVSVSRPTITKILKGITRTETKPVESPQDEDKSQSGAKETGVFRVSPSQLSRLQGISHIEDGKSISLILDRMIEFDLEFRKVDLNQAHLKALCGFLESARTRGFSDEYVLSTIIKLSNRGIPNMKVETIEGLIRFVEELRARGWEPVSFLDDAVNTKNSLYHFIQYKRGNISATQLAQMVNA